jgi:hypothetical protein
VWSRHKQDSRDNKPSCQKAESANFLEKDSCGPRRFSLKKRKGQLLKKLASTSKKLELNSTNLRLKSKKTRPDHAKKPDPSVSYEIKVKNKKIGSCFTLGQVGSSFL